MARGGEQGVRTLDSGVRGSGVHVIEALQCIGGGDEGRGVGEWCAMCGGEVVGVERRGECGRRRVVGGGCGRACGGGVCGGGVCVLCSWVWE